jgi:hypothetical protein
VKYMILIYANQQNWGHPTFLRRPETQAMPPEQRGQLMAEFEQLMGEIHGSGELVATEALADPATTRTLRVRGGLPAITDGPYLEAKEQLAGYFVVDCDSPERAVDIAARFPDALFGTIEIRPVMNLSRPEP